MTKRRSIADSLRAKGFPPLSADQYQDNIRSLVATVCFCEETAMTTDCRCNQLCYVSELDFATLAARRHHPACPLHKTEKHPRLFYYEDAEECWTPAPDRVDCIVPIDGFTGPEDMIEIEFKRLDMTDEEFYNLLEA